MGPDICDIIGGTKNENMPTNEYIENTDHYILNIIGSAIIVLIIQNLYSNDSYKEIMHSIANYSLLTAATLILIITTYIYIHDDGTTHIVK
jgi:predicted Na+-dependent transporter